MELATTKIIERLPLTLKQIKNLSPHCKKYPIPFIQGDSRPSAIILYNRTDREGADEEANDMEDGLQTAGFTVLKNVWLNASEVGSRIDDTSSDMFRYPSIHF